MTILIAMLQTEMLLVEMIILVRPHYKILIIEKALTILFLIW